MRFFCSRVFQCQGMFRRFSLDWRDDQQIRGAVNWVTALSNFSLEEAYFSYAAMLSGPTQKR